MATLQKHNSSAAKAEYPRIVIKDNNCATNDPCAVCGERTDPNCGPELFLEGTWALVCHQCGKKYQPHLVEALDLLRKAERQAERERRERKDGLLKHYARKEATLFAQFDGWLNADDVIGRDADGQGLTRRMTYELMSGADVRVLIPASITSEVEILALLRKIGDWINHGGLRDLAISPPAYPATGGTPLGGLDLPF
jgi:hypothetical protein